MAKPSESALKPYAQTSVDTKNKCTFLIYSNLKKYLSNIFGCKIYVLQLIQKNVLILINFILTSTNYYYFYSLLNLKRQTLFTLRSILRGV